MTLNLFNKWPARGLLLALLLAMAGCMGGPPVQEMSDARQAISAAREAGASDAAPEELRAAEDYLDSALRNLTRKEYGLARDDALEAKDKAVAALTTTERAASGNPRP
jgi:hypothetical protein